MEENYEFFITLIFCSERTIGEQTALNEKTPLTETEPNIVETSNIEPSSKFNLEFEKLLL